MSGVHTDSLMRRHTLLAGDLEEDRKSQGRSIARPSLSELPWKYLARACLVLLVVAFLTHLVQALVYSATRWWIRQFNSFTMSNQWHHIQGVIWSASLESSNSAKQYYVSQLPSAMAAAETFQLHEYFSHTQLPKLGMDWFDMISVRMSVMAQMYREIPHRDDFKIEKNKCDMYSFFKRQSLPFAPIINQYTDLSLLSSAWDSDTVFPFNQTFPVVVKSCHITQGIMRSTMVLPTAQYVRDNKKFIKDWFEEKWNVRPDDWTRPWYREGNEITQQLAPGIFFQQAFESHFNEHTKQNVVVELRVEVLWGHAYLANTDSIDGVNTIVLRDGTVETYPSLWNTIRNVPRKSGMAAMSWVTSQGHLERCVWSLAEKTARLMGIDSVRIDIFIAKGSPDGCVLNEISISSGKDYHMHSGFMAMLWARPHVNKESHVYDPHEQVYAQGSRY